MSAEQTLSEVLSDIGAELLGSPDFCVSVHVIQQVRLAMPDGRSVTMLVTATCEDGAA